MKLKQELKLYVWGQSLVTIVWHTRETGDINVLQLLQVSQIYFQSTCNIMVLRFESGISLAIISISNLIEFIELIIMDLFAFKTLVQAFFKLEIE